ncbi:hypothetical protein AAGG74_18930 [Bacillus mexicanus]|uniref:hypothetical protein n=1 Tax=Bacillus mexicanus TaxID=2834415 RepID=UPI003D2150FB
MNISYIVKLPTNETKSYCTFLEAIKCVFSSFLTQQFPEKQESEIKYLTEIFSSGFNVEPKKEGYIHIFPHYGIDVIHNLPLNKAL